MISVYGHNARNVVTQVGGRKTVEEIRSEPAAGVSRKYESSKGQMEIFPNHFFPKDGSSIFIRTVGVHSVNNMNAALSGTATPRPLSVST